MSFPLGLPVLSKPLSLSMLAMTRLTETVCGGTPLLENYNNGVHLTLNFTPSLREAVTFRAESDYTRPRRRGPPLGRPPRAILSRVSRNPSAGGRHDRRTQP